MGKRKIMEIYAEEVEDGFTFDVERTEDSIAANGMMKMILNMFNQYPGDLKNIEYDGTTGEEVE